MAAGNGSLSATTNFTYDARDNLIAQDGPLPGSGDTVHHFYDTRDRRRGTIGPDPDGAGTQLRSAVRYTFDEESRVLTTEVGTATGTDEAALNAMTVLQRVENVYDSRGNRTIQRLVAGGVVQQLTQFSYDTQNRLECTAVRMNPAVFGSLPASACTLGTEGTAGPDRITRATYDALDRVTMIESGFGTAAAGTEWSATFTPNGQSATLTDGENNRTGYIYDGHDRLIRTSYPHPTTKNLANASDYEQLTYDAASNVTARRLRDGTTITYAYDRLNRLTSKTLPNGEPGATYAYDLLSRPTSAVQAGRTLTFAYDALSRNTSQAGPQGTVSYQYDAAGRRTRMTWPDGFYVTYEYHTDGSIAAIRENGGAALATYAYDPQGRTTAVAYANGTSQSFAFDPLSRLASLGIDITGTSADTTRTFGYNPAGQIGQVTGSNDSYAFGGLVNVDRPYAVNGLNQLTSAGATALAYDARGNLNSSGTDSYTYTSENLMAARTGQVSIAYDPLGRLYQTDATASGGAITRFAYDGVDMIAEYNSANALQRRYVHGPGIDNPIVWYEGAGTTDKRFLHADERGSIVAVSNASGGLIGINTYDEYGIPRATNVGRFQYTGQTWLPEAGLFYYKARMYSPTLGRFMQTDPIGYADGMNWYAYVGNDPVNASDPSGLCRYESWTDWWVPRFSDGTYGGPQYIESGVTVSNCGAGGLAGDWRGGGHDGGRSLFDDAAGSEVIVFGRRAGEGQEQLFGHFTDSFTPVSDGPCSLTDSERKFLVQHFSTPFMPGTRAQNGRVNLPGGPLGQLLGMPLLVTFPIQQRILNNGLAVRNQTLPGHILHSDNGGGSVIRTIIIGSDGRAYSSTKSRGTNYGRFLAGANQLFGPVIFSRLDAALADYIAETGICGA